MGNWKLEFSHSLYLSPFLGTWYIVILAYILLKTDPFHVSKLNPSFYILFCLGINEVHAHLN